MGTGCLATARRRRYYFSLWIVPLQCPTYLPPPCRCGTLVHVDTGYVCEPRARVRSCTGSLPGTTLTPRPFPRLLQDGEELAGPLRLVLVVTSSAKGVSCSEYEEVTATEPMPTSDRAVANTQWPGDPSAAAVQCTLVLCGQHLLWPGAGRRARGFADYYVIGPAGH